jgi:hypothetical protein
MSVVSSVPWGVVCHGGARHAACHDKVHLANDVTKYRSFVLQGLIYNTTNTTTTTTNNNNKTQAFMCSDTRNVEHEIHVYR